MQIFENYDLTNLNTFGISVRAKFFVEIKNEDDLKELFSQSQFKNNERLFLGGGSNILFTKDFEGIVILNRLKGIEILKEDNLNVFIRSMGGESWHDLVLFSVDCDYWGMENLSLVPGTVGAAPIQNIGAYGVELKDILENVEAYSILSGEKKIFSKEECELGYRDSIFKNKLKGQYFITAITVKLNKESKKNVTYKVLAEYLEKNKIEIKSSRDISDAVISIRKAKLPDPKIIGNAGSFFKNVFMEQNKFQSFLEKYGTVPYFEEDGLIKIPAGWLIEQCGWKGKSIGHAGVYEKQSLVLVNNGGATGNEIKDLAFQIIKCVEDKFDLKLIPEVNLM